MRRVILWIGCILIGLAFVSAAVVGLIATHEGWSFPTAYTIAGRPSVFLPGFHLLIVVAGIVIGIIYLVKKIFKMIRSRNCPNLD